ncbi:MAG TPA: cysteine synthase family protein [Dehalococcoidia bacterium]|nr:cysteine synthase family protein [Dehalococcoidia bacterium]
MRYESLIDLIGNTPLVALPNLSPKPGVRFYAKLEGQNPTGSVKDRIAKYMIEEAERTGQLTPDRIVLEPTSGNTGISLAMICRIKGYRLTVVMPESVSEERAQLLRAYGAEIVFSDGARGTNGSIAVAQEMAASDPTYLMLYQYGNPMNPRAHYETTGPEILRDLPEIDVFVAGLGTGGTLTGTGRYLKDHKPDVKVIAAVPHPGDLVQGLRSLEEGFIPPVLDESVLDGKIVVDSRSSFAAAKELTQKEGIFAGISSGAVLRTAQRVAQRLERGNVVMLFADGGWKYLSTSLWTKEYDELAEEVEGKVWW